MNPEEEQQLIARAQQDSSAFDTIYTKYYDQIFNYIYRRVMDVHTAEDITAEVFFKSLQHLKSFQWRSFPFSSWLYRIATNEVNTFFRKKRYQPFSLDKFLEESGFEFPIFETPHQELLEIEEILKNKQDFLMIQQATMKLPQRYQTVIALRFFEKKKIQEIAEILGKNEGTIKSLLFRAVAKIKKNIEKLQPSQY